MPYVNYEFHHLSISSTLLMASGVCRLVRQPNDFYHLLTFLSLLSLTPRAMQTFMAIGLIIEGPLHAYDL